MKEKGFILIFILMFMSITLFSQERVRGNLLVMLDESSRTTDMSVFTTQFSEYNLQHSEVLSDLMNIHLFTFNEDLIDGESILSTMRSNRSVNIVQFNHYIEHRGAVPVPDNPLFDVNSEVRNGEFVPDDTRFPEQWSLRNIGQTGGTPGADISATYAWNHVYNNPNRNKRDIVVAVIDRNFALDHSDINHWINHGENPDEPDIDNDGNGFINDHRGWNTRTNPGHPNVSQGSQLGSANHGIHIQGIVGAIGNNGHGIAGIGWDVSVMPICGDFGNEAVIVRANDYVLTNRHLYNITGGEIGHFIVAVNWSFGRDNARPEQFPIWGAIIDRLGEAGVLAVAATANRNIDVDVQGDIPTTFDSPWLISVTSTDNNDLRDVSAAFGEKSIDLGAPGTNILSTIFPDSYRTMRGTSMAAPHVAGVIGLMYSAVNEEFLSSWDCNPGELALMFRKFIMDGVDPIPALEGITVTGGRLNALNPVLSVLELSNSGRVSMPRLSYMTGIYFEPKSVSITNATDGTRFYYTIDGSNPDQNTGILYTEPILINRNTTLRVMGYVNGLLPSEIVSVDYYFSSNEYHFPPGFVTPRVDGNDLHINWSDPSKDITFSHGKSTIGFGVNRQATFSVAQRFTMGEIARLGIAGGHLTHISFVGQQEGAVYTVQVWASGPNVPLNPVHLAYSRIISGVQEGVEHTVELSRLIEIPFNSELWIGYQVQTNGGTPAGMDNSLAIDGISNLILWNGVWTTVSQVDTEYINSWYIKGTVRRPNEVSNTIEGFNVTRLNDETKEFITFPQIRPDEFFMIDTDLSNGIYLYTLTTMYSDGESEPIQILINDLVSEEDMMVEMPNMSALLGNFPNPFNPFTSIRYQVSGIGDQNVEINVYNVRGQRVRMLVNDYFPAGVYSVVWDGRDDGEHPVGSGIYFYRMRVGDFTETRRMLLMK